MVLNKACIAENWGGFGAVLVCIPRLTMLRAIEKSGGSNSDLALVVIFLFLLTQFSACWCILHALQCIAMNWKVCGSDHMKACFTQNNLEKWQSKSGLATSVQKKISHKTGKFQSWGRVPICIMIM